MGPTKTISIAAAAALDRIPFAQQSSWNLTANFKRRDVYLLPKNPLQFSVSADVNW
jgi:hypothetical protein